MELSLLQLQRTEPTKQQNKFRTRAQDLSLSLRLNPFSIRQFVNLWIHVRTSPEQVQSNAQEQNPGPSKKWTSDSCSSEEVWGKPRRGGGAERNREGGTQDDDE